MKENNILPKFVIITLLFFMGFNFIFADPIIPPPPPPVTSYTYSLSDEFKDCGTGNVARYCDEYYLRWKIVTTEGAITENVQDYVCGKDIRCNNGELCKISNPNDNQSWITKTLTDNWECPNGYGIAQIHEPGVLDPNFDAISTTKMPPYTTEIFADIYFNSFIPACVNRIPMMNFNPKLIDNSNSQVVSEKVGLYAKHETLSYDANPLGGLLKNFYIPFQDSFIKHYSLKSDLKSYRMWSFRQRFVEGLQRTIESKNLQLPDSNLVVESLSGTSFYDSPEVYFSKDFMMGSFAVENLNNLPVGEDINQEFSVKCNFDVSVLNLNYITTANDLKEKLLIPSERQKIIDIISQDSSICNLDTLVVINNIAFLDTLSSSDTVNISKSINNVDIKDIKPSRYYNVLEFETWAYNNINKLTNELKNDMLLSSSDPKEDIKKIKNINNTIITSNISGLKPRDYRENDEDALISYIQSIDTPQEYKSFSDKLESAGDISKMYLVKNINSVEKVNSKVDINVDMYTRDVDLDLEIYSTVDYKGFAQVELGLSYPTSTELSWNWRSLESLTLTQLGRCLYNWDSCLLNTKTQTSIAWPMSEVADLGYGPRLNSLAYIWSQQSLQAEFTDLVYGYHFDGARGLNTIEIPITVYKKCDPGQTWMSEESFYSCYDEKIYKCHYGLSADEIYLGYVYNADFGDTVAVTDGRGFVCINSSIDGPKWKEVNCYDKTNVIS